MDKHDTILAWSWTQLLALRLAALHKLDDLTAWLLAHPRPSDCAPPFAVTCTQWNIAQRQANALIRLGLQLIPVWRIPMALRDVKHLPPLLFVWGNAELLSCRGVGIVGSRHASGDAVRWAETFAAEQGRVGQLIISGGARGIDSAAHRGALRSGAPTIAYVGASIDAPYPSHNRPLFANIVAAGGAIVSEHPPGETTFKSAHALRNRFIAAHASTLTVVEAAESSGTLSTAWYARRMNRPVLVSPEGIGQRRAGLRLLLEGGHAQAHPH